MEAKLDKVEYKKDFEGLRFCNQSGASGCIYKDEKRNKAVKIIHDETNLNKILSLPTYDGLQKYNVVVPEEKVYID